MANIMDLARQYKWDDVKSILEKEPHRINDLDDKNGQTLAFRAIEQGDLPILQYLVEKEINLNLLSVAGSSALHWAALYGKAEMVKYLVEEGKMDVNAKDSLGRTPLFFTVLGADKVDVVRSLVEAGASLNQKNIAGQTAKDQAKHYKHYNIYEYLVAVEAQNAPPVPTGDIDSPRVEASSVMTTTTPSPEVKMKEALSQIEQLKLKIQNQEKKIQTLEHQLQHSLTAIPYQQLKNIKSLGKGPTSEVFLVSWQCKLYAYKQFNDIETAAACIKEASAFSSLLSPYITHIYGKTEDPAGLLMEYMNKGTLASALFENSSKIDFSLAQKKLIAVAAANAISSIHERGMILMNITSANILLHGSEDNSELYAKASDVSTIKSNETTSAAAALKGSLVSKAPELLQVAIEESLATPNTALVATPTKECNVYSFGVLLYELICEQKAYQGLPFNSIFAFMQHVRSGNRPEIPTTCPAEWKALMEKCWKQDPRERPNMKQVLETLETL